jgi:uncharacterized membrane protein YfcA
MDTLGTHLDTIFFSIGPLDVYFSLLAFIVVGFFAQTIDGSLGMAYGVSSTSFLLSLGVPAPVASASVHLAEIATTGVSGLSHHKLGNVDKDLFLKLIVPGCIGSVLGAYGITLIWQTINQDQKNMIKVFIALYLLAMGLRIWFKAFGLQNKQPKEIDGFKLKLLALIGGFSDAIGGGGWGPIVTSTLISNGRHPRYTIGSVNAAEFFVTVAQVIVFLTIIDLMNWQVIIGLILGGCVAAPFSAKICRLIPTKIMMIVVGAVIIVLQLYTLITNLPSVLF